MKALPDRNTGVVGWEEKVKWSPVTKDLVGGKPSSWSAGSGLLLVESPSSIAEEWAGWQWTWFHSSFLQKLSMRESGSKSPLLLHLLLYQVAPQESPVPSSAPSQAQIIEKFSMQAENTCRAAQSLLGRGFAWIGSDSEARPGLR